MCGLQASPVSIQATVMLVDRAELSSCQGFGDGGIIRAPDICSFSSCMKHRKQLAPHHSIQGDLVPCPWATASLTNTRTLIRRETWTSVRGTKLGHAVSSVFLSAQEVKVRGHSHAHHPSSPSVVGRPELEHRAEVGAVRVLPNKPKLP